MVRVLGGAGLVTAATPVAGVAAALGALLVFAEPFLAAGFLAGPPLLERYFFCFEAAGLLAPVFAGVYLAAFVDV
jgi:hypothetical protein